jgi:lipopolysaccharide/colanic/teichoic acid biosynthesis glycosyltransferase
MKASILTAADRLVACGFLLVSFPMLILIAIILRATSKEPILLKEEFLAERGIKVRNYRFRTTGPGTDVFEVVGHYLRMSNLDQLPGFLAVALGKAKLRDIFPHITPVYTGLSFVVLIVVTLLAVKFSF